MLSIGGKPSSSRSAPNDLLEGPPTPLWHGRGMHFSAAELLAEGLLADPRAAVAINDRAAMPGTGDHARVLEISLYGGLSLEILPARGLDIGEVRYLGEPVAWISPIRDARSATAPRGTDFVAHFNGGLLATCGLRNIGPATSDEPMHGDYTFLPAENVHWQAEVTAETVAAVVTGEVRSISLFGASFLVRRRITAAVHAGRGAEITVTDEVENLGSQPAALHILMPPLQEKWAALADSDRELLPLFECFTSLAQALGARPVPHVHIPALHARLPLMHFVLFSCGSAAL